MHDIRFIRDNPDAFDAGMARRGLGPQAARLIELDAARRDAVARLQEIETERNAKSKLIGQAKAKGDEDEFNRLRTEVERLKGEREGADAASAEAGRQLQDELAKLPNLPFEDVPEGADETANVQVRQWGEPRALDFEPRDHVSLGEGLKGLDFEKAAAMSGARFAILQGKIARLERALSAFMLDLHTKEHGYLETSPPLLVRDPAMYGTGQLPKFEEDLFEVFSAFRKLQHEHHIKKTASEDLRKNDKKLHDFMALLGNSMESARQKGIDVSWSSEPFRVLQRLFEESKKSHLAHSGEFLELKAKFDEMVKRREGKLYLIPTAEVPLTNLVRESISDEADFPLRLTAHTPCFRSEAGSAGRDTRGLMRMHQFNKVELVSIVRPEDADAELERMTGCAEKVLQALELPYRTMLLCAGDMGFSARRTYDLEVWLPSQNTYREISSCSNCGDFQARRMNARFRREGEKKPEFLHTLNGSGVAVGRALLAVLENHQNADGSVAVPAALRPYMDGMERLEP
jgi:seryl-tRNA synthetase